MRTHAKRARQHAKPAITLPAKVERIIKPAYQNAPEKAEIVLQDGDPFYREIRIENRLKNGAGDEVALKPGTPVEVVVEADPDHTEKK